MKHWNINERSVTHSISVLIFQLSNWLVCFFIFQKDPIRALKMTTRHTLLEVWRYVHSFIALLEKLMLDIIDFCGFVFSFLKLLSHPRLLILVLVGLTSKVVSFLSSFRPFCFQWFLSFYYFYGIQSFVLFCFKLFLFKIDIPFFDPTCQMKCCFWNCMANLVFQVINNCVLAQPPFSTIFDCTLINNLCYSGSPVQSLIDATYWLRKNSDYKLHHIFCGECNFSI